MAKMYPVGTELTVTLSGVAGKPSGPKVPIKDISGVTHWVHLESANVTVTNAKVPTPPLPDVWPGEVWMTYKGPYFARISRRDLPVRMTPADLSNEGALKTLPVDEFFTQYPKAKRMFSPVTSPGHHVLYLDTDAEYSRSHEVTGVGQRIYNWASAKQV